jgi:hypothetical protein
MGLRFPRLFLRKKCKKMNNGAMAKPAATMKYIVWLIKRSTAFTPGENISIKE